MGVGFLRSDLCLSACLPACLIKRCVGEEPAGMLGNPTVSKLKRAVLWMERVYCVSLLGRAGFPSSPPTSWFPWSSEVSSGSALFHPSMKNTSRVSSLGHLPTFFRELFTGFIQRAKVLGTGPNSLESVQQIFVEQTNDGAQLGRRPTAPAISSMLI